MFRPAAGAKNPQQPFRRLPFWPKGRGYQSPHRFLIFPRISFKIPTVREDEYPGLSAFPA